MKTKAVVIITLLTAALIWSNLYWIYRAFDDDVTAAYREQMVTEYEQTTKQTFQIIGLLLKHQNGRSQILSGLSQTSDSEPFDKDGYHWVGQVGLKFDDQDNLFEVLSSDERLSSRTP